MRDFKGIWIPREIWESENLTLTEKVLLVEIDSLDNGEGCYATNEYFSKFFNISEATITRAIKTLKEQNYIEIGMFNGRQRKLFSLIKLMRQSRQNDEAESSNCLPNNIDNNITNKEKKTRKEKDNETFEEWWALYPKKSSKPKARTKWGNMTITNQKLAMEGLKQQLPYLKTRSMEYIPYPTTWLNQERWNDPIETLKNGKVKATPSWVEDYKKDLENKEQQRKEQQQFTEQELKEIKELFS